MRKYLLSAGMVVGMVLAAGNHPVRAAAVLTITDQNDKFTITHSNLPLTVTGTGTGTIPVTITQGNGDGDIVEVINPPFPVKSLTITQGTGVDDEMLIGPESLIGGVFDFSGTWVLSPGTAATTGSFAEVAYDRDGSVSDLLTWTVASVGTQANISGTFCDSVDGSAFPCPVPTNAVIVGEGPNSFSNQDLTATWTSDPEAVPEPASMVVLGSALGALGLIRRRKR